MATLRRAVFLDLNGTLVLPLKPERLDELRLLESAVEAVTMLTRTGFLCPVVTVQSRIEKGFFSESEFRAWFRALADTIGASGGRLEGPYVCPHRYPTACRCKKPSGALYRRAALELDIDVPQSFVVGDSVEDMAAAGAIGCRGVMVRTGWPVPSEHHAACDFIADDVLEATRWILDSASRTLQQR